MRGSRNFRQGGGSFFFLVLSLFYRSQMVNFKGGPTFSGGSNCLFPIETHITCDFPGGGVRTPYPPPPPPPLDPLTSAGRIRHISRFLDS